MARRSNKAQDTTHEDVGTEAERPDAPTTSGETAEDGHMDFNDPETGNEHDTGGDAGPDQDAEPQSHADHHQDDGQEEPEAPNREATAATLAEGDGAEPEKEYDLDAAVEDTDNTHQDGNNGLHQEEYIGYDDAAELGKAEAEHFAAHRAGDDTSLHSGDIGRRINLSNEGLVHATLAPANRDETIVGDNPEREKGLRPLGPLDKARRTDDAGRPYDGDSLHTVEKGLPQGQGVHEHIPAPTATGGIPEGIMSARAPVPVSGHQRDPARFDARSDLNTADFPLNDAHHAALDAAEDMRVRGRDTFTAAQLGVQSATADALVDAGLFDAQEAMGAARFQAGGGRIFRLTY